MHTFHVPFVKLSSCKNMLNISSSTSISVEVVLKESCLDIHVSIVFHHTAQVYLMVLVGFTHKVPVF